MSGRPNRHSRRPSTGMPSLFSSQELTSFFSNNAQSSCLARLPSRLLIAFSISCGALTFEVWGANSLTTVECLYQLFLA
ncbi:hypothetical protein SUGI_0704960 [Cryptomeria japonica]|nr:hypothetical protein SUGI_0704960 [Cryptomeria japonica]